ncbi:hypothetical protein Tco_1187716 [Tanacetum coccineum]
MEITATIDRRFKTITEASIRRHLKLEDFDGISTLPTAEIFKQLALMGYVTTSDSLTFQKGHFFPQWKFLIHTILYCLMVSTLQLQSSPPSIQTTPVAEDAALMPYDSPLPRVHSLGSDEGRFDDTHVSDQPKEQLGVFSAAKVLADAAEQRRDVENVQTYTRRRSAVSTGSGGVSTASELVSTAGVKAKDKGKAVLQESKPPKKNKKRVRVQMSIDEELA